MMRVFSLVLSLLITGFSLVAAVASSDSLHFKRQINVMTQNLYVGADLERIAEAQQSNPETVPKVVAEVYQTILDTNFKERGRALADEIRRVKPDLIGLQEVYRITIEPRSDPQDPSYPPVPLEVHDYLSDLLKALRSKGLRYKVAAMVTNINVPLPRQTDAQIDVMRLIDRDVILARQNVDISRATARNFRTNLELQNQTAWRGFVIVNARVRGRTYRFANTHLEIRGVKFPVDLSLIQAAQAKELIIELRDETLPVIVVGDFNSAPQDSVDGTLASSPYDQFLAAGYVDTWDPNEPGFTCCQEEALGNADSILNERIDLIFARNINGPFLSATVGDQPADKTPSGLWPSDHAGVVSRIFGGR